MNNPRADIASKFRSVQDRIVSQLALLEPKVEFRSDSWERGEGGYGGGGISCVLTAGEVFERAGVNFSEVFGELPADMTEKLTGTKSVQPFYATGVSIVIHPLSPMVPTVHFNVRYLEVGKLAWFGGGTDLTPYYLFEEDATHFHNTLRSHCASYDPEYYQKFKKWCDEYFFLPHRGETRGVGGIFFDYLGKDSLANERALLFEKLSPFVVGLGECFLNCYVPVVKRRVTEPWSEKEKEFQLIRRGRYAEFNLIYDRGTLFGLRTGGRTESILMSMPPLAKWEYDFHPEKGSREENLIQTLRTPREWAS